VRNERSVAYADAWLAGRCSDSVQLVNAGYEFLVRLFQHGQWLLYSCHVEVVDGVTVRVDYILETLARSSNQLVALVFKRHNRNHQAVVLTYSEVDYVLFIHDPRSLAERAFRCRVNSICDGRTVKLDEYPVLRMSPLCGHLFIFFNRRRDQVRVLYWDRSGYALWAKRLERGRFALPPKLLDPSGPASIEAAELGLILEGITLAGARKRPGWEPMDSSIQ
jgi:hypothetical protein